MTREKHHYDSRRACRLAANSKFAAAFAVPFGAFAVAGTVGSGGTITPIHAVVWTITALLVLVAATSIGAARWLDRFIPVVPAHRIRLEPPEPETVPVVPAPVIPPAATAETPVIRAPMLAIEPPPVVVVEPETVPVA